MSYIPIKDTYGPNFKVEKESVLAMYRKDNCPPPKKKKLTPKLLPRRTIDQL